MYRFQASSARKVVHFFVADGKIGSKMLNHVARKKRKK